MATANLGIKLDLQHLAKFARNSEFNPKVTRGVRRLRLCGAVRRCYVAVLLFFLLIRAVLYSRLPPFPRCSDSRHASSASATRIRSRPRSCSPPERWRVKVPDRTGVCGKTSSALAVAQTPTSPPSRWSPGPSPRRRRRTQRACSPRLSTRRLRRGGRGGRGRTSSSRRERKAHSLLNPPRAAPLAASPAADRVLVCRAWLESRHGVSARPLFGGTPPLRTSPSRTWWARAT